MIVIVGDTSEHDRCFPFVACKLAFLMLGSHSLYFSTPVSAINSLRQSLRHQQTAAKGVQQLSDTISKAAALEQRMRSVSQVA